MKQFFSVKDVPNLDAWVERALLHKNNPLANQHLGKNKTLGLVFLNPSLRTRLSTQKAAINLGMDVMVINIDKEGWALETREGVVMNGNKVEHIKEAAAVMGRYCDILGLRCFPNLKDKEEDYSEELFQKFAHYAQKPILSLESATRHPLQSFADLVTIHEHKTKPKPKVVLTWAPHVKSLPQAVPNSFAEWMNKDTAVDFVIANPEGYDLDSAFVQNAKVVHNQDEALENADFVYVKNWSTVSPYGTILGDFSEWQITSDKLRNTNQAKVMHCLPVRRGLELADEVLDSSSSLVLDQAENRVCAAQTALEFLLQ